MQLNKLGEFGLIGKITRLLKLERNVIKGSGDDCAVLKFTDEEYMLATCDMLVEAVDFTRKDDFYLVGRKALACSISDIAACGGRPLYSLVSLGIPGNISLHALMRLVRGISSLAKRFKISIVGGDLSRAKQLTIDINMLGVVEKKFLALRSKAKVGDIIFVSGCIGLAKAGRHLRFVPRLPEARYLVKNFKINSMIDISDGLLQDLGHILETSRKGALIYERRIPLAKKTARLEEVVSKGEDFELLFTMPKKEAERLLRKKPKFFKAIGEVKNKKYGLRLIDKNNRERIPNPKGFQHF